MQRRPSKYEVLRVDDVAQVFLRSRAGLWIHSLLFAGNGRPIVLLHGVGGHAWMWYEVARSLQDVGRPVAVDFRGYGESQWSADCTYRTEDHADDVEDLLDWLPPGEVDLVGFSWGGLVGIRITNEVPERIRRLVVVDIPPASDQSETDIPSLPAEFDDFEAAITAQSAMTPRASKEMIRTMVLFGNHALPDGRMLRKSDPYFRDRWPFRSDDRWRELRELSCPVLVVRAADSQVLSAAESSSMAEAVRLGSSVEIPDSGHLIPIEQPVALARELRGFLGD